VSCYTPFNEWFLGPTNLVLRRLIGSICLGYSGNVSDDFLSERLYVWVCIGLNRYGLLGSSESADLKLILLLLVIGSVSFEEFDF